MSRWEEMVLHINATWDNYHVPIIINVGKDRTRKRFFGSNPAWC
ncbi:hypothetical protein [Moorena sp. SIOASIH]|nr:hypothetical protein [Moorena sp. SIOASIH]